MSRIFVAFRIDSNLIAELRRVTVNSGEDYPPTMTQVMERGLRLALDERKMGNTNANRKRKRASAAR